MRFIVKTSNRTAVAKIYGAVCDIFDTMKGWRKGHARGVVGYADPCMGDTLFGVQPVVDRAEFASVLDAVCDLACVEWYDLDEHERAVAQEVAHA